jgi:YVTN family beta-propeller protein
VITRTRTSLSLAAVAIGALLTLASSVPATADTVVESVPVSSQARVIAATPDGSKVVIVGLASTVSVLDVATGVESAPVTFSGFAYNVAVSPDGATAIVPTTDGDLYFVDTATAAVSAQVNVAGYVFDVAFSLDGSLAYVTTAASTILVVDVGARATVGTLLMGGTGIGIALSPDGASLFATSIFTNSVVQVDIATNTITATYPAGLQPSELAVRSDGRIYVGSFVVSTVGTIDTATSAYTPIALSSAGPVSAIALTPDGSRLYVPRGFGNEVAIIDTATNTQTGAAATGVNVSGIAITADGTTALTADVTTPAVLVIAIDRPPVLATAAPVATIGTPYSFAVGTGGSPAPSYSATGTLPTGLALNPVTGVISGTPTALGASSFTITATNSIGTASQAYTITVAALATLPAAGPSPAPALALAVGLLCLGLYARRQSIQATSGTRK